MPELRFLRLPEVRTRTGLSRSQIYRLIQSNEFPAPVKVGTQVAVWPDNEIAQWQQAMLQKSGRSITA